MTKYLISGSRVQTQLFDSEVTVLNHYTILNLNIQIILSRQTSRQRWILPHRDEPDPQQRMTSMCLSTILSQDILAQALKAIC